MKKELKVCSNCDNYGKDLECLIGKKPRIYDNYCGSWKKKEDKKK